MLLSIENIHSIVCSVYNIPEWSLYKKTNKREIVLPRQVIMKLAKDLTQLTLEGIAVHFHFKDHTNVIHGIQTIDNLIESDSKFKYMYMYIVDKINYETAIPDLEKEIDNDLEYYLNLCEQPK